MISTLLSRIVILTAGTLYPAYRSYKAVRTKDVKEYVKWMMYWIVFGLFCVAEAVADIFIAFWFPFYYEMKIVFVFWLLSPWTKGASILYRRWIHPTFMKHEDEIDNFLEQAKSESYKQVVSIGSRSLACAREIVTTAALRGATLGQMQLADLHRSYSTGDINNVGKADTRKQRALTNSVHKQSFIEEEEEEFEEEVQVRTWTGTYTDDGQIVEYPVLDGSDGTIKRFDDEEVVVIEDPVASKPRRRSASSTRRNRSREVSDPSSLADNIPHRVTRSKTRAGNDN